MSDMIKEVLLVHTWSKNFMNYILYTISKIVIATVRHTCTAVVKMMSTALFSFDGMSGTHTTLLQQHSLLKI